MPCVWRKLLTSVFSGAVIIDFFQGRSVMNGVLSLNISERSAPRVLEAIARRAELMRMYTREMPSDYREQLIEADRVIATAVSLAVKKPLAA